jgi:hypothetical protein
MKRQQIDRYYERAPSNTCDDPELPLTVRSPKERLLRHDETITPAAVTAVRLGNHAQWSDNDTLLMHGTTQP